MKQNSILKGLSEEKCLASELAGILEKDVDYIIQGNADAIEESLPKKQKLIRKIDEGRMEIHRSDIDPDETPKARILQQELVGLWRKINGLNELSKKLVTQRLTEVTEQLKPFILLSESGYTRSGKASKSISRIIKGGV